MTQLPILSLSAKRHIFIMIEPRAKETHKFGIQHSSVKTLII